MCVMFLLMSAHQKEKPIVDPVEFDATLSQSLLYAAEKAEASIQSIVDGQLRSTSDAHDMSESFQPTYNVSSAKPIPLLPSGANHDAIVVAEFTRAAMLWVRCRDGVSHSPIEHVENKDMAEGALALYYFVEENILSENYEATDTQK